MRHLIKGSGLALVLSTVPACASHDATIPNSRPNFLVIVADDLAWSDLGAFGGEIDTPNLDALAMSGIRFTDFYTSSTCSPTRAMLLTGLDNHRVGLGAMPGEAEPEQRGQPGYEGYLMSDVATVSERLNEAGYYTVMTGKWHLGYDEDQSPAARGFQDSFALLNGQQNHFGANQDDVWDGVDERAIYREGRRLASYPVGVYSADYYADRLMDFISDSDHERPFFAYLAFPQPHWPLQAPAETIAKYKGRYDAGPEALRAERLARQVELGLLTETAQPHPIVATVPWNKLTPDQRALEARRMEIYAAMVDEVDQNVGRIVEALDESGRLDDTVILFLSDNGPHARPEEHPRPLPGQSFTAEAIVALEIDNSLDALGSAESYTAYGPGWAQAGSAPSRLFKGVTTEGGIRSTAFVTGPGIPDGRISDTVTHVTDIAPTLLDLAGIESGHSDMRELDGRSWADLLADRTTSIRGPADYVGWELFYSRGIRKGDWKAVYLGPRFVQLGLMDESRWELFNLLDDPGETRDLATEEPEKLRELLAAWEEYAERNGVIVPDSLSTPSH